MSFFSRKKRHSEVTSTSAQFQDTQQLQFPTNLQPQSQSQSQQHFQSPLDKRQPQPVCPWSAYTPPFGQSPSPFLRHAHALSPSATVGGELFLFGGYVRGSESPSNDLYVISTRDFSTTLLQTSGDVPNPRYGHRAMFTSSILLIWGGMTDFSDRTIQDQAHDDSLYLLDLVSREWARVVVNGPRPGGRYYHGMTLVGSKLFVFGGKSAQKRFLNDIWALDLDCLNSNPFWESYEPPPGNEKPPPRAGHVSVTTGHRIIIFGGCRGPHNFNDTWSFNTLTRKWTELQCTGSIPYPRAKSAAVLVDDVMYVFGGCTRDGTSLGDLTALNLLTHQWTSFHDTGQSPCGRRAHEMASDGRRVFLLGGKFSPGTQVDEAKPIHVLDTKLLMYPKPNSNSVKPDSDVHTERDTSRFRKATETPGELGHPASAPITRNRTSRNDLPSPLPGMNDKSRYVLKEYDDSEGLTEHHAKLVGPGSFSGKEVARLEYERIADLERQLSETLAERDLYIARAARLTDQLAQKGALLEQAEANAPQEKNCAGRELRELQAKLGESLLSRDHALEQARSALQKASCAGEASEQSQRELTVIPAEPQAKKSELAAPRLRLAGTENDCAKSNLSKAEAVTHRNENATDLVNTDEDRVEHRLMKRMQALEAEIASLRGNEKSFEMMECRNEGWGGRF